MKRRQLTNTVLSDSIVDVGLDVGYGATKVVTVDQQVVFPSVWGAAREIKFHAAELTAKYPGDQIVDDEGDWFVGNLALVQLRTAEQRKLRGRTADEGRLGNVYRTRLMKVAAAKLFPGRRDGDVIHVRIATGLPVDHMRGAGQLKEALIGQHHVRTDSSDFVLNVVDVSVMPQPYGTIYGQMLTADGELNPAFAYSRTGVVDVGNYTIDLTLDQDADYIDSASGSVEGGVHLVQEHIAMAYERDYSKKLSYGDIEAVLRSGMFKVQGQPVNFRAQLNEAIAPLRDATLNLMGDLWQNAVEIDVIFISGGGATLVEASIRSMYPQAVLVEDAQFANAAGYLRYALYSAQHA